MGAFLMVEHSLTGRRWVGLDIEVARQAEAMAQATGLPAPICNVLARRAVRPEEAADFLAPTLKNLLPDPRSLRDMEKATTRILAAVKARQKIAIFADYDVDGGTSAALIIDWLRHFDQTATLYIPDRIDEGYGPNDEAMAMLAAAHDLIICVDCGTLSHGPIEAAKGADVVVLDHHLGGETLPPAHAVVNPNRADETGDLAHLCAAGVVFLIEHA
jgi:single-stranded-DNA-specific exonuclease